VSGTANVVYTSKGQVGTGLADVVPASPESTLSVSGTIYRLAQGSLGQGTLDLGRIHTGQASAVSSVQVSNTAGTDGFSDLLRITPMSDVSGFFVGGTMQTLAAGGSSALAVGYNLPSDTSGFVSGTLRLGLTSVGRSGTGLADVALPSGTVNVLAQVYTGQGVWSGPATGQWDDFNNWTAAGGRPGVGRSLKSGSGYGDVWFGEL